MGGAGGLNGSDFTAAYGTGAQQQQQHMGRPIVKAQPMNVMSPPAFRDVATNLLGMSGKAGHQDEQQQQAGGVAQQRPIVGSSGMTGGAAGSKAVGGASSQVNQDSVRLAEQARLQAQMQAAHLAANPQLSECSVAVVLGSGAKYSIL